MAYRPRRTYQDAVDELERVMNGTKRDIGKRLAPEFQALAAELDDLLAQARQPTLRKRLGLWLMRFPAVPWRRTQSACGEAVAHKHGPVTGLICWLGERLAGWS